MALVYTDHQFATAAGMSRPAHDLVGRHEVIVSGSFDAISDHGWSGILRAAEQEYENGRYEQVGAVRVVRITSSNIMFAR